MKIEGLDISHYQGALTPEQVTAFVQNKIRFVYVKVSQGVNFKDKHAENNIRLLQNAGILVGPYHFVTNDNALNQFDWFVKCMGNFLFDLPPAMDCEAFTTVNGTVFSETELRTQTEAQSKFINLSVNSGKFRVNDVPQSEAFTVWTAYSYSYPKKEIIDVIGKNLKTWMKNFNKLNGYPQPVIYTNKASGDRIFDMSAVSWAKYLLWIANWGVTSPAVPNIWKGRPYFIWQDNVVDGSKYKIDGKVDHDVWGNYIKFPETSAPSSSPSPSPSNPPEKVKVTFEYSNGDIFSGTLEEN